MSTITTKDGTQIYYKDWGTGQPVVFSHGWPLSADSWEAQMLFLASNGYRSPASVSVSPRCRSAPSAVVTSSVVRRYASDKSRVTQPRRPSFRPAP